MKKNYLLLCAISFLVMLFASCSNENDLNEIDFKTEQSEPNSRIITSEQAKDFAIKAFEAIQKRETSLEIRSTASANSAEIEPILGNNGKPALFVVNFGESEGFMLLSADKESSQTMIAFNTTGKLDLNDTDPNSPIAFMIEEQRNAISFRINEGVNEDNPKYDMWSNFGNNSEIEIEIELDNPEPKTRGTHKGSWGLAQIGPWSAITSSLWGQANGYNADAPSPNYHLAGCPAVAIGILCRVYSFPTKYEYFNMPNLLPSNTTQSNAISRMFRDIADNIPGYMWGVNGSGASESAILTGLRNLGYTSAKSDSYNFTIAYSNIYNWNPVLLGGSQGGTAHIWIADGYAEIKWKVKRKVLGIVVDSWTEYSDHFYMNWGWYGSSNAWVDQASWPSYSGNRRMWYDLKPNR